jgi:hypothetical protein
MTQVLDPADPHVWRTAKAVVRRTRNSSLHCAIASIDADGWPHVTPIGSVMLGDPGQAVYLDVFNVALGRNLDRNPHCAILAVDSRRLTWARALLEGRFDVPPGVRLVGTVSPARAATSAEVERFQRVVRLAMHTKGGRRLWGNPARLQAREVSVTGVVPVRVPSMTAHLWPTSVSAGVSEADSDAHRGADSNHLPPSSSRSRGR